MAWCKGGLCARAAAQVCGSSLFLAILLIVGSAIPLQVHASASLTGFGVTQTPPPPANEPVPSASPAMTSASPATAAAMALPTHDATVGTMAGEAGTSGGAATYSTPIVVPPGRAGMQPSLSINYNSRSGNGVLGMGWTIGGLTSIHRCPQTPEQDGQTMGVSYASTDRLCLDGQRLVAVSGGYGAANTVYRTEVDSYARITQFGGGLTGTATCFKVEQKDGRIFHYGAVVNGTACSASSAHSRVQPGGASATSSWLVEKIEDRVGNYQSYAYVDYGNGEVLPSTVTYTGFSSTVGDRTVTFAYQARTATPTGCSGSSCASDVSSTYQAGGLTMQTKVLQSITTKVGTSTIRTYTPTYFASQYNGRLFMIDMQECATNASGTACHPATHFAYNDDAINTTDNFPIVSLQGFGFSPSTTFSDVPFEFNVIGDLDGDGTKETLVTVTQSDGRHLYLAQMTGDRQIHTGVDISSTGFGSLSGLSSDIDGSGRAAMVKLPTSGTSTIQFGIWNLNRGAIATTNPFLTVSSNVPFNADLVRYGQNQNILAADLDGDGKTDLLLVEADSTCGGNDALGPQLALFFYRNTTVGQLGPSNTMANFTKQNSHLFCLNRVGAVHVGDAWYAPTIDHIADFNGDGLPDIYMVYSGYNYTTIGSFAGIWQTSQSAGTVTSTLKPASTVLTCDSSSRTSATDECNWQNGYFAHWLDINGDGLEDFVIARPYQSLWQVRLNKGGTLAPAATATAPSYAGLASYQTNSAQGSGWAFAYLNRLPTMDADGDGKPDILIPQSSLNNTAQDNHGFALKMCVAQVQTIDTTESCPAGSPTNAPITGGVTSSIHHCVIYFCPPDPGTGALNLPDNIYHQNVPPEGPPKEWNDLPAYPEFSAGPGGGTTPNTADLSVYHLAALKFTQDSTGAFTVSVVNTPLVSRLDDSYGRTEDLFGDGLADLTTAVGCSNTTVTGDQGTYAHCAVVDTYNGTNYGPTTFPDGTANTTFANTWAMYGNINQGVIGAGGTPATMVQSSSSKLKVKMTSGTTLNLPVPTLPGLLNDAVNGLGDIAAWGYAPLSVPGTQDGIPYYSVPATGGYVDSHHYYFQSSMPAVAGMTLSNGTGGLFGFRSAVYGYGQAIYNAMGRGFQGFQTIVSEMAVDSNDTAMWPRRTRTTITYNQKFPLAGRVASVTQMSPDSGKTFQSETDTYVCTLASRGACPDYITATPAAGTVYTPVLDTQTVSTSDLATGTQFGQVSTVNASGTASGWDAYGNLTQQVVTRLDKGTPLFLDSVAGHKTTTTNTFDTSDTTNWWVNKLTNSSVTSSITYASTYTLPGTATAPNQTLSTAFTWNADRTPATKSVQSGTVDQQSTMAYCYPQATATTLCPSTTAMTSYGLPTLTKICLGSYDANGNCSGAAGTGNGDDGLARSPERITKYSYTKDGISAANDGYFVLSTTNPLNQVTQTTHETNDGQVLTATDPNSIKVVTTYDPFGRATKIDHLGNTGSAFESAIQSAYTSCLDANSPPNPGNCPAGNDGEDSNEANAAFRVTTVQAGYPTQVTWFDLLGRKIKTAHTGFNGTYIATLTDFDVLGTKSDQSTPYYLGDSPFFTGWTYDALGRPTKKIADVSELGGGDLQTDYTYVGRKTNLTQHDSTVSLLAGNACPTTAGNKCLQLSRSTNVLGQLMQTTESPILSGTTTVHTTSYWTEPLGNVVAVKDAEGNITQARYNALGQRTQSKDPDQGIWNFTYDAQGELLTQTDARGVVTTVNSRDALGRTTEQQQVPPSVVPTGLQNETVLDDWTFDPANGIGELNTVTRKRGTNRTTPSANPQVWKEAYGYESATARPSTITTTINESGTVTLGSSMDYDPYGRPNTHTYPSGFVVKNGYTAYGQLNSLSNSNVPSVVYWTATAQNEWDHVTGETFTGSITGTHTDYHSTGQASSLNWTGGVANDKFVYGYDAFNNLTSQARTGKTANTEHYTYDPLQRLTQASRTGGTVNYGYSKSGNLTKKDDFSVASANAYSYAAVNTTMNGCGPHAANSVALPNGLVANYNCDANGNVIGGNTLTVAFDADNHPRTTTRVFVAGSSDTIFCNGFDSITTCGKPGTVTGGATWAYASTGQRYYELANGTARYFGPDGYEQANNVGKVELGPVVITGNVSSVTVVLRDRLGSTLDAIDGSLVTQRAFDAFGAARNGDMSSRPNGTLNLTPDTIHGFTSHTHEDDVALVHMNGRVFDPILARFISVDPIAQAGDSQGLNPYSYVGNRPFSGTDPTGYAAACTVNPSNSCTANGHDDRSADPFSGRVTFSMGNDGKINAHSSEGGATFNILGGNGSVGMSSTGAGGTKNAQAPAADQMALTNAQTTKPGEQAPTLPAISVTASSFLGDAWSSFKTNLQLLLPFGDEYDQGTYNAFAPFGSVPTRRDRLESERAQQAAKNPTAEIVGGAIASLPLIVVPGEGELEAGALAADASSIRGSTAAAVSQIDRAAFRSERSTFWKNEVSNNPQKYTAENIARMKAGKAPIGTDGHPMELHHVNGTPNGGLQPMTRTEHRMGDNYINNHPWLRGDANGER